MLEMAEGKTHDELVEIQQGVRILTKQGYNDCITDGEQIKIIKNHIEYISEEYKEIITKCLDCKKSKCKITQR